MNVIEELKAVYELVKDEANWCKGAFAKNANGQAVNFHSPDACRFCVGGAIRKVTGHIYGNPSFPYIRNAAGVRDIALWNDSPETTHEDVINVLNKAIRTATLDNFNG